MGNLCVDADFIGGGIDQAYWENTTLHFEAPLDASPQSLWFYFRIRGGAGQRLTLVQHGLEHVLGVRESRGYRPVVPVWRDGDDGPWRRVEEATIRYSDDPLRFEFAIEPKLDTCYVAFCYPYQKADWLRFVSSLPGAYLTEKVIGQSKAGRAVIRYLVRSPQAEPKRLIVLTARQHAGEVSGSYVMEGALRRLTDGSPEMEALLREVCFCVVPIMDQDCVEEGRYGKDQAPFDYNRDWRSKPYQPEIAALMRELENLSQRYEILWAFDLHAPQPGGASYMPPARSNTPGGRLWNRMWNMALAFEDNCRGRVSFHLHDVDTEVLNWGGMNNQALVEHYYSTRWDANMTCLEFSYHRDGEGKVLRLEDWRTMGAILVQTLGEKLFDPRLNDAPNRNRIPAWAVPQPLNSWTAAQAVQGVEIQDGDDWITIRAQREENHCWMTSRVWREAAQACAQWTFEATHPMALRIYGSYYRDGLLVTHAKEEAILLDGQSPFVWKAAPMDGCVETLSFAARNITGELRISGAR